MANPLVGAGYDKYIGTRQLPGQQQTEFYNLETNQAYATPADLLRAVQPNAGNQLVNESNVFNVLAQGYTSRDTALNQIKNDLNTFQNDTFNSGVETGKRASSSIADKIGAEQGNYDTYFKEYNDLKAKLQALSAPNYQETYNQLRESSGIGQVENDFAVNEKTIRELPYVNRQNFGNAGVATEGQLNADTAEKGIPLEIQQANLIDRLKLAQSFIDNSLKFKELDTNAARQSLADGLQTALQTIDLSRAHLNDLMAQQQVQKQAEEKAQAFAYENRIGKAFYEIGGTVYRTSDGRAATSPQDYISMGGTGDFSDVQKVDANQNMMQEQEKALVADLIKSYGDAGITLNDSLAVAQGKLANSKIYQDKVRPPAKSGGGGKSKTETKAEQAITDENQIASYLESVAGGDGYVSPEEWKKARQAWMEDGYSASSFDSKFKEYINKADPQDYR